MYARVLRKWSLNKKLQMSLMWLAVVTMLLLHCLCAATTAAAAAAAAIAAPTPSPQVDLRNILLPQPPPAQDSSFAAFIAQQRQRPQLSGARTAAVIPRNVGGIIEESFYISVASDEGDSNSASTAKSVGMKNVASNIFANRLLNKLSSGSSSSSISVDSSNNRLFSNRQEKENQQQQEHEQETLRKINSDPAAVDHLAYSFYYKMPTTTATASLESTTTSSVFEQQHHDVLDDLVDNEEDDNIEEEEEADVEEDDEEDEDEVANDENIAYDARVGNKKVFTTKNLKTVLETTANKPVAATPYKQQQEEQQQKVPITKNSQIIKLFNNYDSNTYNSRQQQQENAVNQQYLNVEEQQQQKPINTFSLTNQAFGSNVRSVKARRHITEQQQQSLVQQQQLPLQTLQSYQQHQSLSVAQQNYHNPVRESLNVGYQKLLTATGNVAVKPVATFSKLAGNATRPLRYIINAFEVPPTLPLSTPLTQQQRRMLFHQKQLQLQQQAARNRRDSRKFPTTGSYQLQPQQTAGHQPQVAYQQQQFQRLQQYSSSSSSSSGSIGSQRLRQETLLPQQQQQQQNHNRQHNNNHNNHHHFHHHHRNQQRQRQRKHPRRYCSARDPAQLAFEAPTVFEGEIKSMTADRRVNFSATVQVGTIFKQQIGYKLPTFLRLQFEYRNGSGECDIYREQLRARSLVRDDELEIHRHYLFYVQQIDVGNFTILGQPIRRTQRALEAVRAAVSENYAQLAAIRSITTSNRIVENGKELRIVCKVEGRPPPKVTWFKDQKSINRNRRLYQFVHLKKRSELIIRSFNSSDAGVYECRAKNKVDRNIKRRSIVIEAYPEPRSESSQNGRTGSKCPDNASGFCLNGGTCIFFSEINEYSCQCPEGFNGERCDRKEINNMPPNFLLQSTAKYLPLLIV